MIGVIARESGQLLSTVEQEPYINARLSFEQIRELRYHDDVNQLKDRIDTADMIAVAYRDPAQLAKARRQYESLAGLIPTVEDSLRAGLRIAEAAGDVDAVAQLRAALGEK